MSGSIQTSKREYWIDSAKGIGVILIVFGHMMYSSSHSALNQLIYSFHVPMFFVLSGMICQHGYELDQKKDYIKGRAKRLIIPFLGFTALNARRILQAVGVLPVWELVKELFFVEGRILFNSPIWFLLVLFEVFVAETLIDGYHASIKKQCVVLSVLFFMGLLASVKRKVFLFNLFGLNRMIICLFFFEMGVFLHRVNFFANKWKYQPFLLVAAILAWCMMALLKNKKVSIYKFNIGNYYFFMASAAVGTLVVLYFCRKYLNKDNILCKLSKYSILILGTQYFIIIPYREMMKDIGLTKTIQYDLGMVLLAAIILAGIPLLYRSLIKRIPYFRALNGEWK